MEFIIGIFILGVILSLSGSKTTKCEACGEIVSKQAFICPHCGHPQ